MKPFSFVPMLVDRKKDATGRKIDFDAVHEGTIRPTVADAGLDFVRTDEGGGRVCQRGEGGGSVTQP